MRIVFRESGGFGGLIRGAELDSSELPPDVAPLLDSLLGSGPSVLEARPAGARDDFSISLTVEDAGGPREISLSDTQVPPELEPLLAFLRGKSGPRPPG